MAKKNRQLYACDEKLRKVQAMVDNPPASPSRSTTNDPSQQPLNIPVRSNAYRKRSFSENWLDHRPAGSVDSGTVLQPLIKRKKKTVAAPKSRDLGTAARYCLTHQQQDNDGEIETQLYKGNVFRTAGGGASVQFTAVETLKQQTTKTGTNNTPTPVPMATDDEFRYCDIFLVLNVTMVATSGSCDSADTSCWTDVETRVS